MDPPPPPLRRDSLHQAANNGDQHDRTATPARPPRLTMSRRSAEAHRPLSPIPGPSHAPEGDNHRVPYSRPPAPDSDASGDDFWRSLAELTIQNFPRVPEDYFYNVGEGAEREFDPVQVPEDEPAAEAPFVHPLTEEDRIEEWRRTYQQEVLQQEEQRPSLERKWADYFLQKPIPEDDAELDRGNDELLERFRRLREGNVEVEQNIAIRAEEEQIPIQARSSAQAQQLSNPRYENVPNRGNNPSHIYEEEETGEEFFDAYDDGDRNATASGSLPLSPPLFSSTPRPLGEKRPSQRYENLPPAREQENKNQRIFGKELPLQNQQPATDRRASSSGVQASTVPNRGSGGPPPPPRVSPLPHSRTSQQQRTEGLRPDPPPSPLIFSYTPPPRRPSPVQQQQSRSSFPPHHQHSSGPAPQQQLRGNVPVGQRRSEPPPYSSTVAGAPPPRPPKPTGRHTVNQRNLQQINRPLIPPRITQQNPFLPEMQYGGGAQTYEQPPPRPPPRQPRQPQQGNIPWQAGATSGGQHQSQYQPPPGSYIYPPPPAPPGAYRPINPNPSFGGYGQPPTQQHYSQQHLPAPDPLILAMEQQQRQNRAMMARQNRANELPTFSGNPLEWPLFITRYRQTTKDCEYLEPENMSRLDKALKGEALNHVRHHMILRDDAESVIKKLQERFAHTSHIVTALRQMALNTPNMDKWEMGPIMDFSAAVDSLVTTVEALNLPHIFTNSDIVDDLVRRLPNKKKMSWVGYAGPPPHDLRVFRDWIGTYARAASLVAPAITAKSSSDQSRGKEKRKNESTFVATAPAQVSAKKSNPAPSSSRQQGKNQGKSAPEKLPICVACKEERHKLFLCDTFKGLNVNQRWELVRAEKHCFNCLSHSHLTRECKSIDCTVGGCKSRHHSLLHGARRPNSAPAPASAREAPPQPSAPPDNRSEEINGNINFTSLSTSVMLRVLPVRIHGPKGIITVNALLDEASSVTMICDTVATSLGISGPSDPLRLRWTNGSSQSDNSSQRITLWVGPVKGEEKFKLKNVRTVRNLKLPAQKVDYKNIFSSYPHLKGISLHVLHDEPPVLLIGQPHIHLTVARSIREGPVSAPIATETRLGWLIHGPVGGDRVRDGEECVLACIHETDDDLLYDLVKEQFSLEAIGMSKVMSNRSREDREAEILMNNITRRIGDRFETGLLWRKETGFHAPTVNEQVQSWNALPFPDVKPLASEKAGDQSAVVNRCVGEHSLPHRPQLRSLTEPCAGWEKSMRVVWPSLEPTSVGRGKKGSGSLRVPPSRDMAYRRMLTLEKKFKKDPALQQQFQAKIDHYVNTGYARKLTDEEAAVASDREWFLPVFAAFHPNKPGKLRIVWDAASKSYGYCLNDFLLTGPDLLSSLPGLLLKFRRGSIAFSGDITEMFHQVTIRKEDQPAQRFLWRSSPDEEPGVYQLEVMMFGSVCSPYCAQYVRNRNASEFSSQYPAAADAIITRHYMDDYLESVDDMEEAKQLVKDVSLVHKKGGFHIGKWIANSPELLQTIPEEDRAASTKDLSCWSEIPTERALGLHWSPSADIFTFRVNLDRAGEGIATGERVPTKRAILRLIMLVWDPLGFLSHFLISARLLLQNLWRENIGWDDEIPTEDFVKWKSWVKHLPKISNIQIPRQYSPHLPTAPNIQLHLFADASQVAYACVAYLRITHEGGVDVRFIISKARVAALKPTTVPKLELQAAHIAARMAKFIREEQGLPISTTTYWSDSGTVLKWIRSEANRYQQFVANRVGEIQELTQVGEWRWVPTKMNPADHATRMGNHDLTPSCMWWCGPEFLREDEAVWPTEPTCPAEEDGEEYDPEMELKKEYFHLVLQPQEFSYLPKIERFSNHCRLLRATAYVLLFIGKIKKKINKNNFQLPLDDAERHLIIRSQWESYGEEIQLIRDGESIPKTNKLFQLTPILDDEGVLRFQSRLSTAPEEGLRFPIILHPNSYFTRLLILNYHKVAHHHNPAYVLNEMRQRFWIPSGKTTIRMVVRSCGECRNVKLNLPQTPRMGDLPDFRIRPQPRPFTITGMDYFGPYECTVGRSLHKRYGVLFTCLSTRAIHLEIAYDGTADGVIMAIRRFIARRGHPNEIHSDQGKNLRGANKELQRALTELDQKQIEGEMEIRHIKWHFIPPKSPHMGGAWERLVRSVKTALNHILKERHPRDDVLQSVFAEAEAVVNSRPLTDVPIDEGSPEALTPYHFLIGTSSPAQPPGSFPPSDLNLRKRWRQVQALTEMFWHRWRKEYLPSIQVRSKWVQSAPNLAVGDVVTILDESLRRGHWPWGVVVGVHPGKDGVVRAADLKTFHGFYRRPVVKLGRVGIRAASDPTEWMGKISQSLGRSYVPEGIRRYNFRPRKDLKTVKV